MRKVLFAGANSLDNYLARSDGEVDWLLEGDDVEAMLTDFWKDIGAVVMGRKTYEAGLRLGEGNLGYSGVKTYVFSGTLADPAGDDVTVVRSDVVEFVRGLKEEGGKDIWLMGGGELARPLFEAGLIDELGFNIHPVLLGSGVPLFHPLGRQIELELRDCRVFQNGCVYLTYGVKGGG